jgi:2-C-methyl-D-erythritol 4-phosphate cytidylyltransferase
MTGFTAELLQTRSAVRRDPRGSANFAKVRYSLLLDRQNVRDLDMNHQPPRYFALVPAAGVGARMGANGPKQYMQVGGKPMLRHTLDAFASSPLIAHTYVVVSVDDQVIDTVVPPQGVTILRCGGASRLESVRNGLWELENKLGANDWVLVHDAARPGLNAALIEKLIKETGEHPVGGLLADALEAATDPAAITDDASAVEALGLAPKLVHGHPRNLKVTLPDDVRIAEMYLAAS